MANVRLVVDGVGYTGWHSVSIKRSLNEPVDSFELGVFDQWSGGRVRVRNGAPYQLFVGDSLISTGYLCKVSRHYDSKTRSVSVSGRSKAADLIDCSYPIDTDPSSWNGLTVLQICNAIAKPFGVAVRDDSGLADQVLPQLTVNVGDKAMDVIQSCMRIIGARLVSMANGNLQIVSASLHKLATPLELGKNVISADDDDNLENRYSLYHVTSQKNGHDTQGVDSIESNRTDAVMKRLRYRPLTIAPSTMINSQSEADALARVACNVAAGESHTTTYEVHGWQHSEGVWTPNNQVKVVDAECGWNDWLMIGTVTLLLDEEGQRAHITVLPVSAYDITAEPQKEPEGMS